MQKIILHVDFNSFFASVEQQANPFLRNKPVAVAGKGAELSNSISSPYTLARPSKIKTSISLSKAQRAPRLSNLHRSVITTASAEAKARGVKTAMSSHKALRLCPELIIIPGDPYKYSQVTHHFLAILKRYSDAVEQFSNDEAFADITLSAGDFFSAVFLAQKIRHDIQQEIGAYCTASIGIAPNKLAAKLAGESVKPSGLTVLRDFELKEFFAKQPLQAICGIGRPTEERLHGLGISSVRTLQTIPLSFLVETFGQYGHFLHRASLGIGDDHVNPELHTPSSYAHSYTFPYELFSESEIEQNLLALCDQVAWRLRRDLRSAQCVSVFVRYADFSGSSRQLQLSAPTEDGLALFRAAAHLLFSFHDPHIGIRLMGVSCSRIQSESSHQSLFLKDRNMHRVLSSLDILQKKFGSGVWRRLATLRSHFKTRTSGWHYDHEI